MLVMVIVVFVDGKWCCLVMVVMVLVCGSGVSGGDSGVD